MKIGVVGFGLGTGKGGHGGRNGVQRCLEGDKIGAQVKTGL